jgi:hypothetical protein
MAGTRAPEDRDTILESLEAIVGRHGNGALHAVCDRIVTTAVEPVPAMPDSVCEEPFRPSLRPSTPRLTILDDGETLSGEIVRLRESVTLIGRIEGHIRLPHDQQVSKQHAEIIRDGMAPFRWLLRDLDSSNCTFVNCAKTLLRQDRIVILGSRRYRLRIANCAPVAPNDAGTSLADLQGSVKDAWPTLVETVASGTPHEIQLRGPHLTLGRPRCGNHIELDDPLIARQHATISRLPSGEWQLTALPSRNGVWAQIKLIALSASCRFQCGEQRFLFTI